jgi:hypothetical protein
LPALCGAPIVGAGCGRFIARRLCARRGLRYLDFDELLGCGAESAGAAANCATAVAVALLARQVADA